MKLFIYSALALLTLLQLGCSQPVLTDIVNDTAYPRQILGVEGSGLGFTNVKWDAGLANETNAKASFFSARYFQVPATATVGDHPVRLDNSQGTSANTIQVNTLASSGAWPDPRIQDIGLYDIFRPAAAQPVFWLSVAVANGDIDAKVFVNNVEQTTLMYSAIPSDYLTNHTPSTYNYPIYHYTLYIAVVESASYADNLDIKIRNNDGTESSVSNYQLPSSYDTRDTDGDGLLDRWEADGYSVTPGDTIDLAAMGCDPKRKDLLVEVDWIAAAQPQNGVWADMTGAFAAAPILNPDGSQGINLIIDRGQGGAFTGGGTVLSNHTVMDFGPAPSGVTGYTDFFTYKSNTSNFDPDRQNIFHYCIFGRARPNGTSGRGEVWGNDHMVTFRNFGVWAQQLAQSGTFMHEFGHNLGLWHGGIEGNLGDGNEAYKPNMHSVMGYRYQFGGASNDCSMNPNGVLTYSEGIFNTLDESSVSEATGICDNTGLDYNCDGDTSDNGPMDIDTRPSVCPSGDGANNEEFIDYDQWGNLKYKFDLAASRWQNN